jgi:hypothetical protein
VRRDRPCGKTRLARSSCRRWSTGSNSARRSGRMRGLAQVGAPPGSPAWAPWSAR